MKNRLQKQQPNLILSLQNFSSSLQIRGSSFLWNELLPYLFLEETGWVGSFHLIPVTLLCVYYHIRVHMYIYVKYITCTHRRSQLDPQTFLFRNLVHSLKNVLQNFLVFSKMDAGTEKQLSQKWSVPKMADITRGTPFFIRSKGEKVRSRLTVTPLIRSILLNSLPKVAPIDVDSVDAFSYQLCHIEPDGLVCHIAANRYSCTQTLNCPCISWTVKVLTSQPPDSIGVALSIKTSLAASLSR